MKKIELEKKAYQKPEIACYQMESCLLVNGLSGANEEDKEIGGFEEDDDDPFSDGGGK